MDKLIDKKGIVVFGGALLKGAEYEQAYQFMVDIIHDNRGAAIITGGGPGAMEAANKAAFDNDALSIGFPITFGKDEKQNKFLHAFKVCDNFTVRKEYLMGNGLAYIVFPGGFGTADELFEILTLFQLNRRVKAPIYLVGLDYWKWFELAVDEMAELGTIRLEDKKLYKIVDINKRLGKVIKNEWN